MTPAASAESDAVARAQEPRQATFPARRLLHDMGSSAAVAELMDDYVQTTGRDINSLRGAAHDLLLARRIAHRIKGAARLVGAGRIEEIAVGVEARAGANSLMPGALRMRLARWPTRWTPSRPSWVHCVRSLRRRQVKCKIFHDS